MPRPVHFDISADDTARAVKFYSNVFGWKFEKWGGPFEYWMITTGASPEPGIDGGMSKREAGYQNSNTIGVSSVDEYTAKITAAGGKITRPKAAIPSVGWFAMFTDPDGNQFGILQPDESAK